MKHRTLQTRLNTRLFLVLLGLGTLFLGSLYYYMNRLLESEIESKANLIFSNLTAVQTYVRQILRPVMYETLPQGDFVIEAMSTSYFTRKVMSDLNMARDQFQYRRVALDARNPEFQANEMEMELILHFRRNPGSSVYTRFFKKEDQKFFLMARPVIFEIQCLVCHGSANDAPAVLLNRYGRERGFGRKVGDIEGLDSIMMPVERQELTIHRLTIGFILVFTCGSLIILGLNHFFFDRSMVFNIHRLADLMRSRFPDEADPILPEKTRNGGEIESMIEDMERFADRLRTAKAILESIFQGIADPLFLLKANGEIVHTNTAGSQLIAALAHHGENPAERLAFSKITADTSGETLQKEVLLPDGRSLLLLSYPVTDASDSAHKIVYARDNTREKTLRAQFQQSEKAIAVGSLAAGLAHEINNPLGVILCYARLLYDDGKNPDAQDLEIIIRHTLQAQKVLSDLLRFARSKPEVAEAVNIGEIVGFIVRVFQVNAAKQGIQIETGIPADLPAVRGNASAIEQILTNILLNAFDALEETKHNGGGGRIQISGHHDRHSGEVRLRIHDNGPGIAEENLNRVFDPFFTTKAVGRGTGLGLSVVYGLVRDLGAKITASNQEGAVFEICFLSREENVRVSGSSQ